MERHEAENLSAVLWEREHAAKEKLEAGYDPVVMSFSARKPGISIPGQGRSPDGDAYRA